jgi:hypothetical protein
MSSRKSNGKKPNKQKGLTDTELVAKYEKGGMVAFKTIVKAMLANPNPNVSKKTNRDIS